MTKQTTQQNNLPAGWQEKRISEFAEVITGGTPSTMKKEYWENGNVPWLPSGDLKDKPITSAHVFITKEGLDHSAARVMPKKSVLIALTGATTGQVALLEIEASANQSVTGILPSKEHVPEFLFYYLRTFRPKILDLAYGAGQPHISQGFVKNIKIPLPPLPTQKKIVSILEKAEKLKQKRGEADKKTAEYLQSVFYEMFLKGNKYPMKELEECCLRRGEYGSGGSAIEYDETKPRYVRITDIDESGNLREDSKASASIIENNYLLEEGDLLFARSGATVGKTYMHTKNNSPAIFAGYLIRFKPNKKIISPEFLFYFTKTQYYLSWVASEQKVVAQPNINAQQYGHDVKIPIPPLPLQQKFAKIVEKVEKLKEKQKGSKQKIDELFDVLMQKAFRGELVR